MAKKILLILLTFFVLACGNTNKANKWYNIGNGDTAISMIDTLNRYQLDSLCNVDVVSRDFKHDWLQFNGRDYETRKYVTKYLFIKSVQDSTEILYTLRTIDKLYDTLYVVEKRITYYDEE